MIIDIDRRDWIPELGRALGDAVPPGLGARMRGAAFRYVEDALEAMAGATDPEALVDRSLDWVRSSRVRAFHGTRLTDEEAGLLAAEGLRPLSVTERLEWLRSSFPAIGAALSRDVVEESMRRGYLHHREGQVHAAISERNIRLGYEYLHEGSEFDRRLLQYADRYDLVPLLMSRGTPRIVRIVLPGTEALEAMHPFFDVEETRRGDRFPNLVRPLLEAFAWNLHSPDEPAPAVDSCLLFRRGLPGPYIEGIEEVPPHAAPAGD